MKRNTYSDLLKDPRWQRKRLEIMHRDDFTCVVCGDKESTLNVHHREYIAGRKPWEYENEDLITVCEDCHLLLETLKKLKPSITLDFLERARSLKFENDFGTFYFMINKKEDTLLIVEKDKENNEFYFIKTFPFSYIFEFMAKVSAK